MKNFQNIKKSIKEIHDVCKHACISLICDQDKDLRHLVLDSGNF